MKIKTPKKKKTSMRRKKTLKKRRPSLHLSTKRPQTGKMSRSKWIAIKPSAIRLSSGELMNKIITALEEKKPLSVVSVGHTESFVMAQYKIFPKKYFMNHGEAKVANKGITTTGFEHRGIRFPNVKARDEAVEAVRKADIVGYITVLPDGVLAEKVFEVYDIKLKYTYEAYLRRVIMYSQKEKFEEMLRGRKILLISSIADEVKNALDLNLKNRLGFEVVGTISIYGYDEIPRVKQEIAHYEFDLCLLAAGINAVILAPYIAETYGKVAFDLGLGLWSLSTGKVSESPWLTNRIGINTLMKM
ncbi:GT-D fold domain-containing glycosyltransferase [Brevibacillus sp. H7]|uniref:GT-D fold domain-containing glycosyltransferase n=1 Tax=Brevibacillus sp. H7 TaxID=3349138 RepID=UPI0037FDDD23